MPVPEYGPLVAVASTGYTPTTASAGIVFFSDTEATVEGARVITTGVKTLDQAVGSVDVRANDFGPQEVVSLFCTVTV